MSDEVARSSSWTLGQGEWCRSDTALLPLGLATLVPGVAWVAGVALCFAGIPLVLGRNRFRLPGWLGTRLARLEGGTPRWLPQHLRPRLPALSRGPILRLAGLAVLMNGLLIALPIPFGNMPPAIAVLLLAAGLRARDGVMVLAGLGGSVLALAFDLLVIFLGYEALLALIS